jgi:hypothetical protein
MRALAIVAASCAACTYTSPAEFADASSIDAPRPDSPLPDVPIDTPQAFWINVVGAVAMDNNLTNAAPTGDWDGGASTRDKIMSGNGYVEFSTQENMLAKAFGLSSDDANTDFTDIDFAIHLRATGKVFVYEKGVQIAQFGMYVAGDVFRVEVVNNIVSYKKNGTPFFTSVLPPTFPLLGDAAFFSQNATLTNVSIVSN